MKLNYQKLIRVSNSKLRVCEKTTLLATDEFVAKDIMEATVGDQIYFKGYLSHYSHNQGFKRGTSIVRTDRGNGACETVFITDFQILKEANIVWRGLHAFSCAHNKCDCMVYRFYESTYQF